MLIISLCRINWLVCITETQCVYCAVRTGSLYTTSLTFSNSTFCPHSVFMCFVWIWEQTAIISLYNINWLVCITETECVYCAVRTVPLFEPQIYNINICSVNLSFCLYKETIRHWLHTNTTVHPSAIIIIIIIIIIITQGMCHAQFSQERHHGP